MIVVDAFAKVGSNGPFMVTVGLEGIKDKLKNALLNRLKNKSGRLEQGNNDLRSVETPSQAALRGSSYLVT